MPPYLNLAATEIVAVRPNGKPDFPIYPQKIVGEGGGFTYPWSCRRRLCLNARPGGLPGVPPIDAGACEVGTCPGLVVHSALDTF